MIRLGHCGENTHTMFLVQTRALPAFAQAKRRLTARALQVNTAKGAARWRGLHMEAPGRTKRLQLALIEHVHEKLNPNARAPGLRTGRAATYCSRAPPAYTAQKRGPTARPTNGGVGAR
jgi:hypothetical protein